MGGERETTVSGKSASVQPIEIGSDQKIRIHENAGEVHFHDDVNNLKVAVPAAEFWTAWTGFVRNGLAKNGESVSFVDATRQTGATIKSVSAFRAGVMKLNVEVELYKTEMGDSASKIHQFATAK